MEEKNYDKKISSMLGKYFPPIWYDPNNDTLKWNKLKVLDFNYTIFFYNINFYLLYISYLSIFIN